MGLSKLNVFISGIDDPCGVDNRTWYVTVYTCDGEVFQWCDHRYVLIPAKCGHVEIELPPGCYYLKAVWGFTTVTPGLVYRVNHFTDAGIVTLCCNDHQCIKLFNPSAHRCGYIYVRAVRDLVNQRVIKGGEGEQAEAMINNIIERVGKPDKLFELGHEDEILKLLPERIAEHEGRNVKG